ncbi:DUF2637 domain-containing protein [Micromonospora sp. NPDC050686]|uniref:DUF2637 domain-containing protein n=1 Tax=Micromonospora sp. NPDC050686 TaxID=3154631 RepID=UPI0033FE4B73
MSATPDTTPAGHAASGKHLYRLRWAVRATLTLGVAASVAANVLHARPNPISQIIAAWPPLALLLTVELISRVPHHRRALGVIRIAATAVIAAIATWVSYWHLVGVAAHYGETDAGAAYLLPISVDGLVIVASVSLVELTARIRATTPERSMPPAATTPTASARPPDPGPVPEAIGNLTAEPARPLAPLAGKRHRHHPQADNTGGTPNTANQPRPRTRSREDDTREVMRTRDTRPMAPGDGSPTDQPPDRSDDRPPDKVPSDTAAAVAYWHHRDPDLHPAQIAERIGRSERTVRRHWPPPPSSGAPHINGHLADSLRQ